MLSISGSVLDLLKIVWQRCVMKYNLSLAFAYPKTRTPLKLRVPYQYRRMDSDNHGHTRDGF